MSKPAKNPLKLFYCYSHEDKDLRNILDKHLISLKRESLLKGSALSKLKRYEEASAALSKASSLVNTGRTG
jgi:hypothetical protein